MDALLVLSLLLLQQQQHCSTHTSYATLCVSSGSAWRAV